jgi:hypothetical protein
MYRNHKNIKTPTTIPEYTNDENRPVTKNKRDPDAQQHIHQIKKTKKREKEHH